MSGMPMPMHTCACSVSSAMHMLAPGGILVSDPHLSKPGTPPKSKEGHGCACQACVQHVGHHLDSCAVRMEWPAHVTSFCFGP